MNLYAEVLPPQQQDVLRQLGHVTRKLGYYLGGGTAVAIHLGHRRSVDLDWFTEGRMDDPMRLATQIRDEGVGWKFGASTGERSMPCWARFASVFSTTATLCSGL